MTLFIHMFVAVRSVAFSRLAVGWQRDMKYILLVGLTGTVLQKRLCTACIFTDSAHHRECMTHRDVADRAKLCSLAQS